MLFKRKKNSSPHVRTMDQCNADYSLACAQLGDTEYKITCLNRKRRSLEAQLDQLESEGTTIRARQATEEAKKRTEAMEAQAAAAGAQPQETKDASTH